MTKAEIIEVLTEAGIEFDSSATKAELEALLPVNETDNGIQEENKTEEIVKVFDKRKRLMRTFTGQDARKQAEALASQPRRDGWTVV